VSEFAREDAEGSVRFKEDAGDLLMELGAPFADLRTVLNSRDPQDRRHAPGTPVLLPEKIARKPHVNHLLDGFDRTIALWVLNGIAIFCFEVG
jgi:hypothetical protein